MTWEEMIQSEMTGVTEMNETHEINAMNEMKWNERKWKEIKGKNEWMNEWTNEWINEWNEWMNDWMKLMK